MAPDDVWGSPYHWMTPEGGVEIAAVGALEPFQMPGDERFLGAVGDTAVFATRASGGTGSSITLRSIRSGAILFDPRSWSWDVWPGGIAGDQVMAVVAPTDPGSRPGSGGMLVPGIVAISSVDGRVRQVIAPNRWVGISCQPPCVDNRSVVASADGNLAIASLCTEFCHSDLVDLSRWAIVKDAVGLSSRPVGVGDGVVIADDHGTLIGAPLAEPGILWRRDDLEFGMFVDELHFVAKRSLGARPDLVVVDARTGTEVLTTLHARRDWWFWPELSAPGIVALADFDPTSSTATLPLTGGVLNLEDRRIVYDSIVLTPP